MVKTGIIIAIIAIVIVLAVAGISIFQFTSNTGSNAGNQGSQGDVRVVNNNQQSDGGQTGGGGNGEETPSNANPQTYTIDISNFAFSPFEIRIKAGDTIVWTNKDSIKHTVTSDSGNELGSSLLGQGESYSHTFNTAGTFAYHCSPHPYMKGKVIVE